ncbi:hypothetical protein QIS99_08500 [Streptomyces sp. B-S-A8]|uniref:Secreted protein n=1 Tax=Streptomyces solicavernae TaxID=3043614 RepID=A0ABT6RPB5_9ACTN|nr:hypothetical protein [Streptomyces sp. B-S-A8]MDI3386254.1 hypothetical protein [Streptomyces sp. B-S-A8]
MPSLRRAPVRASAVAAASALALLGAAQPAAAQPAAADDVQLNGVWAPFTRCPVDDPVMLAADGVTDTALCISSRSASGSITIGSRTVPTGATDLQAGVVTHPGGRSTVVPPPGGALVADPAQLPGGLLGLMCPSDIPLVSDICARLTDSRLNRVTATVESVGRPTDFNLLAGVMEGRPILTLPVRIKLDNPFLGENCYLGSASEPIVLRPQNTAVPAVRTDRFAGDGTPDPAGPLNRLSASGADQQDTTYAVPGAAGCGLLGSLDWAVNLKTGLPAAAGTNAVRMTGASTSVAAFTSPGSAAPEQGKRLSEYWHSAVR